MQHRDSEIQQAVLHELARDPRIDETEVGVEVDAGVVTLTGTVSSWAKRIAAQEAAHHTPGVLDVANDLRVQIPGAGAPSDTELAHAVRNALEKAPDVAHEHIRCTVSNGLVTLCGTVRSWDEHEQVERALYPLSGIRGVVNELEVEHANPTGTRELASAIEEALQRHASREARHLILECHDGVVTISGVVHSWAEKQAVLGAARGSAGVRRVISRLRIEPYAV